MLQQSGGGGRNSGNNMGMPNQGQGMNQSGSFGQSSHGVNQGGNFDGQSMNQGGNFAGQSNGQGMNQIGNFDGQFDGGNDSKSEDERARMLRELKEDIARQEKEAKQLEASLMDPGKRKNDADDLVSHGEKKRTKKAEDSE